MKTPITVSVCLTAHNAEKYLPGCLDSILAQSLASFEVVCVNDGSTDSSWSVIEEYAAKDRRIRGLNRQQNSGVGVCRNIAVRAAQGEYILAVDADDALPPEALSLLYSCAARNASEAVVGGLEAVDPEGEVLYRHGVNREYINVNPAEYPQLYIYAMGYHTTILLNREFILRKGVFYKEGVLCSAYGFFLFELFFHLTHVSFIPDIVYKYIQTSNSIRRSKHSAVYYIADFSAYQYLYECAAKNDKIHVADIRFSYRLRELLSHDLRNILKNLTREEILSVLSFVSSILKTFSVIPRLFKYTLPMVVWLQQPSYKIFFYELQKEKLDVAIECYNRIAAGSPEKSSSQQKPVLEIHMAREEREFFLKALRRAKIYIEFGSGGSTVAAAAIASISAIYSVESDADWIRRLLRDSGIRSALGEKRLTLIHADIGPTGAWGAPVGREGERPRVELYKNYFWAPWERMPRRPDIILIDGRFRVACAIMAALMAENPKCLYFIHDYPRGGSRDEISGYRVVEKFFDLVRSVESLSLFKRKKDFDYRAALLELHKHLDSYD
ncbi:MAG: glycosyltransferase [Desulfovibrio sp.]|jgi:glycosyltransferase involved in cell wall biosynthesis|nr:glycosyltransferase [Desulfovibrio sp.]